MNANPVIERYLNRLDTAIADLDTNDREEIMREIRNHLAEATASGRSLDAVIDSLGSAEALARAYAAELLVNPRRRRPAGIEWAIRAMKVVVGSVVSLVIVAWLLSMIGLGISGVLIAMVGVLEATNVHIPGVTLVATPSPTVVVVLGLALSIIGVVGYVLLRAYLRVIARAWKRARQRFGAAEPVS